MKNISYHVLGVMSGTSLDGIDLAEVTFHFKQQEVLYEFGEVATLEYNKKWKGILSEIDQYSEEKTNKLNIEYTQYLGEKISDFIKLNRLTSLDAVCSHGHTVWHQPEKSFTLQIGNLPLLAQIIKQKVVCDFRVQDVLKGGQGAPLVPIGDRILFSQFDACINLGGFANISEEKKGERLAYDICPVNIVLNHFAKKCGFEFDPEGRIAASGKVNKILLEKLNQLDYYQKAPPKSLGKEWVRQKIWPLLENSQLTPKDILATFTSHIAHQIAFSLPSSSKILFTGGGVYNDFLMKSIRQFTSSEIVIPSPELIEYKEALIFGLLGVLKLRGEINILKSVTGAREDHSSGKIFEP